MAGVSLKCGDCGVLLKSVEEAQEHAKLTSHSNFSESTEAVLNVVCTTYDKPCRSKTLSFVLRVNTGWFQRERQHYKRLGMQLLTRMKVPANAKVEAPKPSLTPEQLKAKQQEARLVEIYSAKMLASFMEESTPERAKYLSSLEHKYYPKGEGSQEERRGREEDGERNRKGDNSVGKELLEAKRIEEENERKSLLALQKAEKEEEWKAREKIRQKLEEDKAERRRRLGLPPEVHSTAKPSTVVEVKKERVGSLNGGIQFLEICGFEKIDGGEFLFLRRDKVDMTVLNSAGSELDSATKNPFFGVL
ncbi:hypothetical protein L6164_025381 [Bauhinia variegata]|uniref:Uncharacterized protein n=1 Tax=Bauhinia variegata TaxID=167791 RepID=A0ACB9M0C6_BAUVA|nr:hypothetical protein L6164_025381 [Bauhinia variegata]